MKVAVVGLGLFGKSVALNLARAGMEVVAIDLKLELVDLVRDDVMLAIRMDATDERELRAQAIDKVDVLVASIGDNFEANQLLVILAKQLGIGHVVARASSQVHARILRLIGADEVVLPEAQAAESLARRLVEPSLKGYFQLLEGFSVAEIVAPAMFHGRTLQQLDLRARYKVNLVAITRPGENGAKPLLNAVPLGTDVIHKGDILAVAGRDKDIKAILNMNHG